MVEKTRTALSVVMRGLDPRIHDETQLGGVLRPSVLHGLMDCRVKPGNDSGEVGAAYGRTFPARPRESGDPGQLVARPEFVALDSRIGVRKHAVLRTAMRRNERICCANRKRNSGHSGTRAISAFTRVFDALWRANPESRCKHGDCFWIPGPAQQRVEDARKRTCAGRSGMTRGSA